MLSRPDRAIPTWTTPSLSREELHELVQRAAAGDATARNALFRRLHPWVVRQARRWRVPEQDREDIVQEVFLQFHKRLDRAEMDAARLPGWLCYCIRHRLIDHFRQRQRRFSVELPADFPANVCEPVLAIEGDEEREALWRVIEQLNQGYQEVLRLRLGQGLSMREIATELDIPRNTVGTRLHAARRVLLRKMLENGTRPGQEKLTPAA